MKRRAGTRGAERGVGHKRRMGQKEGHKEKEEKKEPIIKRCGATHKKEHLRLARGTYH